MKICIISTSALPAPPTGYGGLEWIAYHSAVELAKLGNDVFLITTNESTALGVQEVLNEKGEVISRISIIAAGPTSWSATGERDMFLNYHNWLEQNFAMEGVIIDHTWWGYPYFSLTGGEITIDETRTVKIDPHPNMKILHVIHGVTGWRRPTGEYVPPPGVLYPRIVGVSKAHAQYLSNCFKLPVRHVFNGVKIPDNLPTTIPSDGKYLLSLNRISEEKGIHNAIDVCLATKTPLKVVGDDVHVSKQEYVWKIMERCALSDGLVEYIGSVDNDRKWEYIRGCSALIACPDTSNYVESFYMAAVEGWSQGKPIITIPNGGLSDIVVDGVNGFKCSTVGEMKEVLVNGKEVYIPFRNNTPDDEHGEYWYYKKKKKLEDLTPDLIKQEAQKYTVEKMAQSYLDLCKGVEVDDPSYRW